MRLARIARRDGLELDEAKRQTAQRERVQLERYRRHYGLNVEDKSIYHLVLDTSILSIGETANVLIMTARGVRSRIVKGVQASLKLRSGRASRVLRGRK